MGYVRDLDLIIGAIPLELKHLEVVTAAHHPRHLPHGSPRHSGAQQRTFGCSGVSAGTGLCDLAAQHKPSKKGGDDNGGCQPPAEPADLIANDYPGDGTEKHAPSENSQRHGGHRACNCPPTSPTCPEHHWVAPEGPKQRESLLPAKNPGERPGNPPNGRICGPQPYLYTLQEHDQENLRTAHSPDRT
eukprot:scaffold318146_cov50-Prasinocladus_malaysianus.AAC.2